MCVYVRMCVCVLRSTVKLACEHYAIYLQYDDSRRYTKTYAILIDIFYQFVRYLFYSDAANARVSQVV